LDRDVGDPGFEVRFRWLLANASQFVLACLEKPASFLQFGIKLTDALLDLEDRFLEHLSTRLILGQGGCLFGKGAGSPPRRCGAVGGAVVVPMAWVALPEP
jgi:hypothetical protein